MKIPVYEDLRITERTMVSVMRHGTWPNGEPFYVIHNFETGQYILHTAETEMKFDRLFQLNLTISEVWAELQDGPAARVQHVPTNWWDR